MARAPYLTSTIAIAATIIAIVATIIAIAATRRSDVENGLRVALLIGSSYAVLSRFSVIIIYVMMRCDPCTSVSESALLCRSIQYIVEQQWMGKGDREQIN